MDERAVKIWRAELRPQLIERRVSSGDEDRAGWSSAIDGYLERLLSNVSGRVIAFCWPYQAEYDARPVIRGCLARGARGALPVVVGPRRPMVFRQWMPDTKTLPGVYDIPIPVESPEVLPDIALIPCVGFDEQGYRMGYGAGFFDRTLAALQPKPVAVGIAFELSRIATIHPQWHDVRLDYVVTEKGTQQIGTPHAAESLPKSMTNRGGPTPRRSAPDRYTGRDFGFRRSLEHLFATETRSTDTKEGGIGFLRLFQSSNRRSPVSGGRTRSRRGDASGASPGGNCEGYQPGKRSASRRQRRSFPRASEKAGLIGYVTMAEDILFTFQSGVDLNEIWESIAAPRNIYGLAGSDNMSAAQKFADRFVQICELLTNHPEIGLERDELHPGVRSIRLQRYVLFYRARGAHVEVLRVLPAMRDVTPGVPA